MLQEFSKSSTRIDIAVLEVGEVTERGLSTWTCYGVLKLVQACSALLPCRALQHKTADVLTNRLSSAIQAGLSGHDCLAAFQLFFMDSTCIHPTTVVKQRTCAILNWLAGTEAVAEKFGKQIRCQHRGSLAKLTCCEQWITLKRRPVWTSGKVARRGSV